MGRRTEAAKKEWLDDYWHSSDREYRSILSDAVGALATHGSVLEIGCHCGPMLDRIMRDFPGLRGLGVDCSEQAIDAGRKLLAPWGDRIELMVGDAVALIDRIPSRSVEVVISCYTLAHIRPDEVRDVLIGMCRVARVGAVVMEPHGKGIVGDGALKVWAHDYASMLDGLALPWRCVSFAPQYDGLNAVSTIYKQRPR
jgi:hypothetical protein